MKGRMDRCVLSNGEKTVKCENGILIFKDLGVNGGNHKLHQW